MTRPIYAYKVTISFNQGNGNVRFKLKSILGMLHNYNAFPFFKSFTACYFQRKGAGAFRVHVSSQERRLVIVFSLELERPTLITNVIRTMQ